MSSSEAVPLRPAPVAPTDPGEDRTEDILEAALWLISERGYRGATIKAIAQRAGLRSPALIYWYVADKEDLLRRCLERYGPVLTDPEGERARFDEPPPVFLGRLLRLVLARFHDPRTVAALRIVTTEAALLADHGFHLDAARPANLFAVVRDYLAHQVQLGVLRPHDPTVAARLLVAQLTLSIQGRGSSAAVLTAAIDDDHLVDETLAIVLTGLQPTSTDR